MRILENDIIVKVTVLLLLLCGLVVGNIYTLTCRKKNIFSMSIHLSSLFWGIYLYCRFIQTVVLDLDFERTYYLIGNIVLWISFLVSTWPVLLYIRNRLTKKIGNTPELSSILTTIEEISIVADYEGRIIEINLPEKQVLFSGKYCETLEALQKIFGNLISEAEVFDQIQQKYFKVLKASINGKRHYGTIILFHDITQEKMYNEEIEKNNIFLEQANKKLRHYVDVVCQLESEKERLQLIEEIQIDLIGKMETVLIKMNGLQQSDYQHLAFQNKALQISEELRMVLHSIRESVRSLAAIKEDL